MTKIKNLFIKIKNIIYAMFFSKISDSLVKGSIFKRSLIKTMIFTVRIMYPLNIFITLHGLIYHNWLSFSINLFIIIYNGLLLYFNFYYENYEKSN